MKVHRLKRNFTAGELSPLMVAQVENDRFKFGCRQLHNMVVLPQGPVSRREGFQFISDLTPLMGTSLPDTRPRMIPFVFDEEQAYVLIFFKHSSGTTRVAFAANDGLVEDPGSPGNPYVYELTGTFEHLKMAYKQSADIIFIAQPNRTPIELKRLSLASWIANEIAFTDKPADWNTTDGFPRFIDFFEQRIVFLSTAKRPQTVWFSKSGDFYDFGKSSPITASDAVTLTMDSGTQNKIQWTNTTKQLLVGTMGDEWAISGSGYEPLSFQANKTVRHTNIGAEFMPALMLGPATLFLERHGRRVNQFIYDYNADSYDAVDLSVLAPHLTSTQYIVDWTHQQSPNGVVWCVRDDGTMIALTFKREHKITGWHVHSTHGKFLSVCAIPGNREDDVWCTVEREIEGVKKWYLEKKSTEFKSESPLDSYFLDSHLIYNEAEKAVTFSGLGHLEGRTVSVLADGGVQGSQVVASGEITIDVPANRVVVGLPYESVVEPTLLDLPLPDGTTLGRTCRINRMDVVLDRSIGFEYGRIDEEGEEILEELSFRYPSDETGKQVPLFSGVKEIDFPEGYGEETRVLVRQRNPLPLTVVAIIDEVEVLG